MKLSAAVYTDFLLAVECVWAYYWGTLGPSSEAMMASLTKSDRWVCYGRVSENNKLEQAGLLRRLRNLPQLVTPDDCVCYWGLDTLGAQIMLRWLELGHSFQYGQWTNGQPPSEFDLAAPEHTRARALTLRRPHATP